MSYMPQYAPRVHLHAEHVQVLCTEMQSHGRHTARGDPGVSFV